MAGDSTRTDRADRCPASDLTTPLLAAQILGEGGLRRLTNRVVARAAGPRMTTTTPLSEALVARLPASTPDEVTAAVARGRRLQKDWAALPASARAAVLWGFHQRVLDHQWQVLDLIQIEAGKARTHAFEEVADVGITAAWYARHGPGLLADRRHRALLPLATRVTEVHHPWGVVGIIAPWNYPLSLSIGDALPALLAGNAVVVKPDVQTSLTVLWCAEQLAAAGLPDGLLQVVVGDGPTIGGALVDAADAVSFTGSTRVGRQVAQRSAARLVPASLELGGKNSVYIADDADLDRAADGVVRDCFSSAGQLCMSTERVIVHERVADAFTTRLLARARDLRLGTGLDWSADVGSLGSQRQLDRVCAHVDDAVTQGATVLTGGRHRPDIGPYVFEPTVLAGVPPTARCHREETFGPVTTLHRVAGDDAAVAIANDTDHGLHAGVWTADTARAARLSRRIVAGSVSVNETHQLAWGSIASPIGGRRGSGLGRRHGAAGLLRFTQSQTIAEQRVPLPLPSDRGARFARALTAVLRAARRVRLPWP